MGKLAGESAVAAIGEYIREACPVLPPGILTRRQLTEGTDYTASAVDDILEVFWPGESYFSALGGWPLHTPNDSYWFGLYNDRVLGAPIFTWADAVRFVFSSIGLDQDVTLAPTITQADRYRMDFTAEYVAENGDVYRFDGYISRGRDWPKDGTSGQLRWVSIDVADEYNANRDVTLAGVSVETRDFTDEINTGQKLLVDFRTPPGALASFDIQVTGNLIMADSGDPVFPLSFSVRGMDGDSASSVLRYVYEEDMGQIPVIVSLEVIDGQLVITQDISSWANPIDLFIGDLQIEKLIVTEVHA